MLFNSLVFLIFAALFFALWPLCARGRGRRWGYLVVASFVFYGWWDWRFLFLILASGLLDFWSALGMARRPQWRRALLIVSIIGNVGSLAAFKYIAFFTTSLNGFLSLLGDWQVPVIQAALPVGISFYTFQSMSYTIDVYRGKLEPTPNVLHFFAYLALFPQLVAGPIVRAAHLLPQLLDDPRVSEVERWQGLRLIAFGFFKKMVLADNLAPAVNAAFASPAPEPSAPFWWLTVTMFALQIYYDFSGYSDIARGLGKWLGLDFPVNFDHPYMSRGLREFWTRWHISLSTWFRDYVYLPLGGSRLGAARGYLNLWITFLLSGLWHGAGWTFVIWGAIHAAGLSLERLSGWRGRLDRLPGGAAVGWLGTMVFVWVGWVFFRAVSLEQALAILGIMFNPALLTWPALPTLFLTAGWFCLIAGLHELAHVTGLARACQVSAWSTRWLEPVAVALLLAGSIYLRGPGGAFIYFQF